MSLQLAAAGKERSPNKVVELIAPKKTPPSELLKLISSKVNPGKVRHIMGGGKINFPSKSIVAFKVAPDMLLQKKRKRKRTEK